MLQIPPVAPHRLNLAYFDNEALSDRFTEICTVYLISVPGIWLSSYSILRWFISLTSSLSLAGIAVGKCCNFAGLVG